MLRKIVLTVCSLFLALIIGLPLYVYNESLSLLTIYPEPIAETNISNQEISAYWKEHEPKVDQVKYSQITPYWIYDWLAAAVLHDHLGINKTDPYSKVSIMASRIAIHHMRMGATTNKPSGMLWWHILHVSLGIYIQRNWSAKEIVVKYRAINS
ncbi:Uncharacterised protein [BD1-7 clade bacterium]|uniref:Uncharacterized protein n=1 Tax=BD1-7 clade bacterium TaxID=2029982 RepID=A0A5S9QW35_9GAMM|nr:Uncharacterised protein [BD1-7 clade bacterium]